MSDFIGSFDFGEREGLRFDAQRLQGPREVFIEVGDSKKKANVIRDKIPIPVVEVDKGILDEFVLERPKIVNKVVSQSIAAGAVVTEGAAIDLVMAPARSVPGKLFPTGHVFMRDQLLLDVYAEFVEDSPAIKKLLAQRPDAGDLTAADIGLLTEIAESRGVEVEETPGKSATDLFISLQIANTFIG